MQKRNSKTSKLSKLEQQIAELKSLLPAQQDWRSTDAQEIARRQLRALESPPAIQNLDSSERLHSSFLVTSADTGTSYTVEIIDLSKSLYFSTSPDFATNGLGTCKHTEAVLFHQKNTKKPKRKLTNAEKKARRERKRYNRENFEYVFINGKQKKIRKAPTIEGISEEEFLLRNTHPIFLHQNEMWEWLDQTSSLFAPPKPFHKQPDSPCASDIAWWKLASLPDYQRPSYADLDTLFKPCDHQPF